MFNRLECSVCKRKKFRNDKSFLVHMEVMHDIQFDSVKDAIETCGELLSHEMAKKAKHRL
jgi:hypothetical protein